MSRLIRNIELYNQGEVTKPDDILGKVMQIKSTIEDAHKDLPRQFRYLVTTRFSVQQIIGDDERAVEHAVYIAKEMIVNAVHGEFREPLLKLMIDLRYRGMENEFRQAEKIYNEMFNV